jgi:hypothetical protein
MRLLRLIPFYFLFIQTSVAQTGRSDKDFIKNQIDVLASPAMHGRGYVKDGRERASAFLQRKFSELKLKPVGATYIQGYTFPVNTFPGKMQLAINGKELKPGVDFLIDAGGAGFSAKKLKVDKVDLGDIRDTSAWKRAVASFDDEHAYVLLNIDSFCSRLGIRKRQIAFVLPHGCFIIPESAKFTWTVETQQADATVFYVKEDFLQGKQKHIAINAQAKFLPKAKNENVIGIVPGLVKDTFVAFTAHYDHLGMMGEETVFPGASDNASGTAMMLYLASYFSTHPQKYSMLFIAFSGEEAGLLGSEYYVSHPVVPLGQIKFLTNIDIMGDASDGVTVVNATEYPHQFELLNSINDAGKYIPVIKSRGKARNSDHYHFSEAGVPAFFMYSNGGKGHYHDIYDTADEVTLNNTDGVAKLLIGFAGALK